jgi:hypothetical protein
MSISPTAEGFRTAFRRPSLAFAEITWRWVVGATATALFFYGLFEYLRTLPVSNRELLLLRSRHPYLVSQALAHILRGSLGRVVAASLIAGLMLSLLWMIAASVGRMAIVRAMLDYFRVQFSDSAGAAPGDGRNVVDDDRVQAEAGSSPMRALVRLNFLRVAVTLAAVLGLLGALILSSFVSSDAHPRPALAFLLFLLMAALVFVAWSLLNWLLSLAAMFAVRDGADAIAAISTALAFIRERTGAVFAVSTWTGLAHVGVFMVATSVISMPMSFAAVVPWRLVVAIMILTTLGYFALVDWLYTARLAGFVCIAELPEALLRPLPPPPLVPPSSTQLPVLQTTIDRNEVILSDVSVSATQTSVDRDEVILSDAPKNYPMLKTTTESSSN